MVISGMNRFFERHGRIAFGLIAVVISVSFVLYMSGVSFASLFRGRTNSRIGSVFGKNISRDDYLRQIENLSLIVCLENPMVSIKNINKDRLAPSALQRLIQLRLAEQRGIDVSEKEIADYLIKSPAFQKDSKFDLATFKDYVKTKLEANRYSKEDLDIAVRDNLIITRLHQQVTDTVISTPEEIRSIFNSFFEKYKVKVLRLESKDFEKELKITDDDLKNYFSQYQDKYKIPRAFSWVRAESISLRQADLTWSFTSSSLAGLSSWRSRAKATKAARLPLTASEIG